MDHGYLHCMREILISAFRPIVHHKARAALLIVHQLNQFHFSDLLSAVEKPYVW